jgi:hypothetical protein
MRDLYMHYKFTGRFLLNLKFNSRAYNIFEVLKIQELNIFFFIKDIEDLDKLSVSSSFYFFKYFFGTIGFFLNYQYHFSLNVGYHTFILQSNFYNRDVYFPLFFFLNDVYFMLNKNYISKKNLDNVCEFIINDMNFFVEKKTTLGFFNLLHKVGFRVSAKGASWMQGSNLFLLFKI